ncbi:hypothetical protein [Pseudomonas rustica]|uniref:Uncharacterized protein n=1 Tax=Pseudomonas rustica TaxID=2827099 RepID=A0ABS5MTC4_9PSED|nr:hypothetical protein [Pseudomonas rustica]MBS4077277.1 hypothetical protein [Pseudomonas rustica]
MSDATKYGQELWLLLAPTFDQATALDGFGTHPEKAQAFAGFIAAACGAMLTNTGHDYTMNVLAAIAQQVESIKSGSEVKH